MKLLFGPILLALCVGALNAPAQVAADAGTNRLDYLASLSLNDLLVTSVSKKPEKQFDSAAAVFVLGNEEIVRSGARTLPDALRLVPGVQVAQMDASFSAVGARGFSGRFANKLLVLVDGRAVYTPAFGGVYWEDQNIPLESIDRIEVIRGPGGTLWGANAVNGVINIVTKDAKDTQGWVVNGGGGNFEQGFGYAQYGLKLSENANLRTYLKYDHAGPFDVTSGVPGHDRSQSLRTGLRYDWHAAANQITFQGDYSYGQFGHEYTEPAFVPPFAKTTAANRIAKGGNALVRWTHYFEDETDLQVQAYYDHVDNREVIFGYELDTYDVDMQHRIRLPWRQELVYGFGYRLRSDESRNHDTNFVFLPSQRTQQLVSVFAQDEITLVEERLRLILGSKLEHNDYTGWEVQPNARLVWTPTPAQTIWGAVSRAIRSPGRSERDLVINLPAAGTAPPVIPRGFGSSNFESEILLAYELGYRVRPFSNLTLDWTGYYFDYDRLGTAGIGQTLYESRPGVPLIVVPTLFGLNGGHGYTYGFEFSAEVRLDDWWHIRGGYSLLQEHLIGNAFAGGGGDPEQQALIRSSFDVPHDVRLDLTGRYVDNFKKFSLPGYLEMDARLAWRVNKTVELAIAGRNLISPRHIEFVPETSTRTAVTQAARTVYAEITLRF